MYTKHSLFRLVLLPSLLLRRCFVCRSPPSFPSFTAFHWPGQVRHCQSYSKNQRNSCPYFHHLLLPHLCHPNPQLGSFVDDPSYRKKRMDVQKTIPFLHGLETFPQRQVESLDHQRYQSHDQKIDVCCSKVLSQKALIGFLEWWGCWPFEEKKKVIVEVPKKEWTKLACLTRIRLSDAGNRDSPLHSDFVLTVAKRISY
jgi:hypothetical protein